MAVVTYTSDDSGSPTYNNTSVIECFKAILVDGYAGHPAAGWSVAFSAIGKYVFLQPDLPPGAPRRYLRVMNQSFQGFVTMSTVDTGTGAFGGGTVDIPTSAAPHKWIAFADHRTFYFFGERYAGEGWYTFFHFGDFFSYGASDPYRCVCMLGFTDWFARSITMGGGSCGQAVSDYTGTMSPQTVSYVGDSVKGTGPGDLAGVLPYPHPADSRIWIAPLYVCDSSTPTVRGKLRGFWHWLHPTPSIADRDTFSGSGDLAGKTFMIIKKVGSINASDNAFVIETSNTWDTNT